MKDSSYMDSNYTNAKAANAKRVSKSVDFIQYQLPESLKELLAKAAILNELCRDLQWMSASNHNHTEPVLNDSMNEHIRAISHLKKEMGHFSDYCYDLALKLSSAESVTGEYIDFLLINKSKKF